jgi:hypothetical protein
MPHLREVAVLDVCDAPHLKLLHLLRTYIHPGLVSSSEKKINHVSRINCSDAILNTPHMRYPRTRSYPNFRTGDISYKMRFNWLIRLGRKNEY